jgi:hypothetical protein
LTRIARSRPDLLPNATGNRTINRRDQKAPNRTNERTEADLASGTDRNAALPDRTRNLSVRAGLVAQTAVASSWTP